MDGLLRVLDLDHAWLPFGSGGLNEEGRTRRLPLQPCFSVYFYFIKLRDIFGQLFLGVLAFGLLGLAGFSTTRGLTGFWVAAAKTLPIAIRFMLRRLIHRTRETGSDPSRCPESLVCCTMYRAFSPQISFCPVTQAFGLGWYMSGRWPWTTVRHSNRPLALNNDPT
jgi:hypothetical protein